MKKLWLLVLCLAFFACSQRETPADSAAKQNILLVGNSADPSSLDPSLTTGLPEYKILCALFEGLVGADTKTLEIVPAAAESWIAKDKVYEFKIRDNAKWSDGENLKASDFVFAFKRILNPALGAEYANFLYPIKNAEKIHKGRLNAAELGASAVSEKILRIELEYPCANFLSLLYHSAYFPLPEHTIKKFNAENRRDGIWMRPKNTVSNGPFILTKWSINELVSVRKNPNFHDAKNIKLEGIDFLPISNMNTEDRAFRAGQLHITDSLAPTRIDAIKKNMPENLRISDWLNVYYYVFNTSRPPLDNAKVRMALSMAIDRELIVDTFLKTGQKPAYSFVPEAAMQGYKSKFKISKNIEEAKKLLAQAGYPDGKKFPKISIAYNSSELHKPIAEAIQAFWKKNLGIEVSLYNLSWPAYLDARRTHDFFIMRAGWVADYASPESFLSLFVSDNPLNHSLWKSEKFDAFLNAAKTNDANIARQNFENAEEILLKDSPLMPIYFYTRTYLIDGRVANWDNNALDFRDYKKVFFTTKDAK